jgi:hypothetical protein
MLPIYAAGQITFIGSNLVNTVRDLVTGNVLGLIQILHSRSET